MTGISDFDEIHFFFRGLNLISSEVKRISSNSLASAEEKVREAEKNGDPFLGYGPIYPKEGKTYDW